MRATANVKRRQVSGTSGHRYGGVQGQFWGTHSDEQRVVFRENKVRGKVCRDCRTRKPLGEFPRDRYGRVSPRWCRQCADEHIPALLTETEAAQHMGVTLASFRALGTPIAGSYTPRTGASVPLFSRERIDTAHLPKGGD